MTAARLVHPLRASSALLVLVLGVVFASTMTLFVQAQAVNDGDDVFSTACPVKASTCLECVSNNCGWVPTGLCLVDCQYIADIACYSNQTVGPLPTADDICAIVQAGLNDSALCRRSSTSCSECVATTKSDGIPCAWVSRTESCSSVQCNIFGCGKTTCSEDDTDVSNNNGGGGGGGGAFLHSCRNITKCIDCLDLNCGWTEHGDCLNSCKDIADAGCYSNEYFEGKTPAEICVLAENDRMDGELCRGQNSCSTCVTTDKSDGASTCQWYVDEASGNDAWCGTGGCDMNGVCGSTECETRMPSTAAPGMPTKRPTTAQPASTFSFPTVQPRSEVLALVFKPPTASSSPTSCTDNADDPSVCHDTCEECLTAGHAWAVGQCIDSCNFIADVACYSTAINLLAHEICTVVANDEADEVRCRDPSDCATCTSTFKSDGVRTCSWYVDEALGNMWCGTGGCNINGVCSSTACETVRPSSAATGRPTKKPTTIQPTRASSSPTLQPQNEDPVLVVTTTPTTRPTTKPTREPTTKQPARASSTSPTLQPQNEVPAPVVKPPTTSHPTSWPTKGPTITQPTRVPSSSPTLQLQNKDPPLVLKPPTTTHPTTRPMKGPTTTLPMSALSSSPTLQPQKEVPTVKTENAETASPVVQPRPPLPTDVPVLGDQQARQPMPRPSNSENLDLQPTSSTWSNQYTMTISILSLLLGLTLIVL